MLKNITLSADEELIRRARERAQNENSTLNASFRQWLKQYAHSGMDLTDFDKLLKSLEYARAGRTFSRNELNER